MKAFRRLALVALVLVSAVVVVASPAFATPRLTTSTGTTPDNGAVSPFISPIGNTLTSSITITNISAAGRGSSFTFRTLAGANEAVTCIRVTASGEIGLTHTRISIYSLDFLSCRTDTTRLPVHVQVNHISSSNPFYIHLTRITARATSADGVFEIPVGSSISFWVLLPPPPNNAHLCEVVVGPQSIRGVTVTDGVAAGAQTIMVASGNTVDFALPFSGGGGSGCPDPRNRATQATGTLLPYTADDRHVYTITALSRLP